MSKIDDLLAYIEALEDFARPCGRFADGPASTTPHREGIICYGFAIDNSTPQGRAAIKLYDTRLEELRQKREAAYSSGALPRPISGTTVDS